MPFSYVTPPLSLPLSFSLWDGCVFVCCAWVVSQAVSRRAPDRRLQERKKKKKKKTRDGFFVKRERGWADHFSLLFFVLMSDLVGIQQSFLSFVRMWKLEVHFPPPPPPPPPPFQSPPSPFLPPFLFVRTASDPGVAVGLTSPVPSLQKKGEREREEIEKGQTPSYPKKRAPRKSSFSISGCRVRVGGRNEEEEDPPPTPPPHRHDIYTQNTSNHLPTYLPLPRVVNQPTHPPSLLYSIINSFILWRISSADGIRPAASFEKTSSPP